MESHLFDTGLVDEIKRRMPLTSLAGVRPKGYAHCPHGDCPTANEPSKEKAQIFGDTYKCWVCGNSGDIFHWIQAEKGCGFVEALHLLADRAGVSLVPNRERSGLLQKVVSAANRFLFANSQLMRYLEHDRGIPKSLLYRYQVGYVDPEGHVLRASGLSGRELLQLGFLAKPRGAETKYWSRMAGRYLFPIRDVQGRVVQVKGRQNPALDWGDDKAKSKPLPMKPEAAPGDWGTVNHHNYLLLEEELYDARRQGYACLWEGEPDTYTAKKLGYPSVGLQGSEGLYKHAHKLEGIARFYVGLDNDAATELKLVKELLMFQVACPGKEIRRVRFPHCAGNDFEGRPLKVDANDYHVKYGGDRQAFDRLLASAVLAQDIVIAALGPKYDVDDRAQSDLKRLFRATPAQHQPRFITQLAEVTGFPEQLIAFGMDPRAFKSMTATLHG